MARSISDTSDNVVPMKRGRGRPKGSTKEKAPKMTVVAESGVRVVEEDFLPADDGTRPTLEALIEARKLCKTPEDAQRLDLAIAERRDEVLPQNLVEAQRAPSFGHNQLDEGSFLRWVQKLAQLDEKGNKLKLALKEWRTERKLLRKEAGGDGIALGVLDEALEDLKTEQVDIAEREQRRRDYHLWLGIPFESQDDLLPTASLDPENEAKRWFRRGEVDGRQAKIRELPPGIPPEHAPDFLRGHTEGTEAFLRGSPLTAAAFRPEGAAAPEVPETTAVLTLREEHFADGTPLEEANLKTLLDVHRDAWAGAECVVALFGAQRRVLREPDESLPGGYYEDDGSDDVDITEPEAVAEPVHTAPSAEDLA